MRQQAGTSTSLSKPLIGFAGRKGAGKATAAQPLLQLGYASVAFADPVRRAVCALLGISICELEGHLSKETIFQPFNLSANGLIHSMRAEWGMSRISESIWIDVAKKEIQDYFLNPVVNGVVVKDVRTEAEARAVREMGGMIIHINREIAESRITERGICVNHGVDCVVENADSITALQQGVLAAMGLCLWDRPAAISQASVI